MNWLDLLASILGITCVVLAGRNSKYNFWVGYLYTTALFALFWQNNLVASLMLQPVSLGINIMGHYRWTHPKDDEKSSQDSKALKVTMLSWPERILCIFAVFIIAFAWGWLLDRLFPADPHPYLDSCVTVLILMAQFLSAQKKWDCWVAWLIVNVTQMALHLSVGNFFMPIVCGLYLINGIISLLNWGKLYKKNAYFQILMAENDILLDIRGLHASIGDKEILKGIDLTIRKGEVHAVMGPNGAGKSTLSAVLVGRPDYTVTEGSVTFLGRDLLAMSPEERSWAGIFLSFQSPIEIPGVSITNFMKAAVNARRKAQGLEDLKPAEFIKMMKEKMAMVQMKGEFAKREVNVGFSGGEKKRNEIFQMAMLDPMLSILDETDSGLDVDALRIVAEGVNKLRTPEKSAIVITHYQRLLEYIVPDVVHVLKAGRIVKTGGRELVDIIDRNGYDAF